MVDEITTKILKNLQNPYQNLVGEEITHFWYQYCKIPDSPVVICSDAVGFLVGVFPLNVHR